jgi:hypothetical protein
MIITIVSPGEYLCDTKEEPKVGGRYLLEDAASGTRAQNNAFHALLDEYYRTWLWSYQGSGYNSGATYDEFRNMIKRKLGAGFESFVYAEIVGGKPFVREVKTREEIPEAILRDPDMREMIRGRLKSWADYTKRERRLTMDKLITEMVEVGVNTPHFREILDGMEEAFK